MMARLKIANRHGLWGSHFFPPWFGPLTPMGPALGPLTAASAPPSLLSTGLSSGSAILTSMAPPVSSSDEALTLSNGINKQLRSGQPRSNGVPEMTSQSPPPSANLFSPFSTHTHKT